MKNKLRQFLSIASAIVILFAQSGCFIFKKDCDCPNFSNKKQNTEQNLDVQFSAKVSADQPSM